MVEASATRSRALVARLRGVHKSYGNVRVLEIPELDLYAGEVVGVVGENGAGKSTLIGTLAGSVRPEGGVIEIAGHRLPLGSTEAAARLGVGLVSQEFPLVGQLSVAENMLLGRRVPGSNRRWFVDRRRQREEAEKMLSDVGLDPATVHVTRTVRTLPVPTRQLLEIAKAWGRKPKLLILDEPTSALGPVEASRVLALARDLANRGGTVLFIGHRLDEVREISDRVVVLRNGHLAADLPAAEATEKRLIREMVGSELADQTPTRADPSAPVVFEAVKLTADGLGPIDIAVRAGEILGVAGLMGSGRSRLVHTIAGAQPSTGGSMSLAGKRYAPKSPKDGADCGISLIPEDRKEQSLVLFASIRTNVTVSILRQLMRNGLLSLRKDRTAAREITKGVNVRMQSIEQPVGSLSGGNQQRAIFGRAFSTQPRILLLDEPTRGVDVGAKAEIYELIRRASSQGMAVIAASSELEELLLIANRIAVMNHGSIVDVIDRLDATKERIMTAAAGTTTGLADSSQIVSDEMRSSR